MLDRQKKARHLLLQQLNSGGFTLIELIVALAITTIVISLTGTGLYALMKANQRSQIETTDRLELEQALAFITDEIKMSRQVQANISWPTTPTTAIGNFNPASGSSQIQPILVLIPASSSRLKDPIVYYLADPPNSSVWSGQRVIYRWGPTLLQNGNYSDGDGHDIALISPTATIEYYNEVLVDRISDVAPAQASIACESSYSYSVPSISTRLGFYACIAPDEKSVKLWMYKQKTSSAKSVSIDALVVTRSN
ncbi:PulJ/GspJ family protein [Chamaesiphon minutus]|uniref:Prepilin-type N-terminal cleavage/methylation domain-containing protein n=1 Tax=Chamaesiphon minutus (strain ATCC 27169 / PCC 6605) TaxID=1173020 RepID=K9UM75_CHAP6|nr:prepilin-type N-terminal cleavage/methylation domain-containing protein [Chamaesiphon minutus]AFY95551.1 prepilin-type N-terminal cleavage/methylation domain-containing protein [Chamaesiphon minutus PCC 6605]